MPISTGALIWSGRTSITWPCSLLILQSRFWMAKWPLLLSRKCWSPAALGQRVIFYLALSHSKTDWDSSEPRRWYSLNESRGHKTQATFHRKSQRGNSNISISTHKPSPAVWLFMKILSVFHNGVRTLSRSGLWWDFQYTLALDRLRILIFSWYFVTTTSYFTKKWGNWCLMQKPLSNPPTTPSSLCYSSLG